jgi:nitrogen-specific signal transduction histidine kinase
LGLFIVREIVRAHEGHVDMHSDGAHTVFTARLPRRDKSGLAPRATTR